MGADAGALPADSDLRERTATLEANRTNDVRRLGDVEAAVGRIERAGWIVVGAVLIPILRDSITAAAKAFGGG